MAEVRLVNMFATFQTLLLSGTSVGSAVTSTHPIMKDQLSSPIRHVGSAREEKA